MFPLVSFPISTCLPFRKLLPKLLFSQYFFFFFTQVSILLPPIYLPPPIPPSLTLPAAQVFPSQCLVSASTIYPSISFRHQHPPPIFLDSNYHFAPFFFPRFFASLFFASVLPFGVCLISLPFYLSSFRGFFTS